jgi:uncharacterized membrane protein YccC
VSLATARQIVQGSLRFERDQVQLKRGIRYAVGAGVPLFIAVAVGHPVEGVAVAGGALMVGLTDSGAPYRQRVRAMLIAAVGASVSTFVGEVTGGYDVVAVLVLALWSFGAGMFISLGLSTYFVALMCPLAVTLVASYPADAVHSLERAAFVFVGGAFSIALVLALWRVHAHLPERAAIAKLYRALAGWVRDPDDTDNRNPVLVTLGGARQALDLAEGHVAVPSPTAEAFRILVDEADRTYIEMVALRNVRKRIEAWDTDVAERAFGLGREAAADALAAVAGALESGRWHADVESIRGRLGTSVKALGDELERRRAAGDSDHADELEGVLRCAASVRGEMRAAVDLAVSWQGRGTPPDDPVRHARPRPPDLGVRGARAILRANLTLRSGAFRHAVRLGLTMAIATAIYRIFDLPRGYWVPLTVLFVLRPDFGATFTRGLQRYVGTALGAVLATVITAAFSPGEYTLAALVTVCALGIFAFLFANYGLFTLSITACIIFLVAFTGTPEYGTAVDRLIDTTIGATLTLAIYALWPTWERATLPDTMSDLLQAERGYIHALFASWLEPDADGRAAVRAARTRARVARTNTEAAVQRAMLEPTRTQAGFGTAGATGVLTGLRRFADGALGIEAYLDGGVPPAPGEVRPLALQVEAALEELADAARARRAPGELPPVRETQQALAAEVGSATPVAEETDRMVNSLVVVAHVLERFPTLDQNSSTHPRPLAFAR